MKGSAKVVKGRIEEAAGALSNNDALRAKGRNDQTEGHVTQSDEMKLQHAKVIAHKIVDKAKSVAKEIIQKADKQEQVHRRYR